MFGCIDTKCLDYFLKKKKKSLKGCLLYLICKNYIFLFRIWAQRISKKSSILLHTSFELVRFWQIYDFIWSPSLVSTLYVFGQWHELIGFVRQHIFEIQMQNASFNLRLFSATLIHIWLYIAVELYGHREELCFLGGDWRQHRHVYSICDYTAFAVINMIITRLINASFHIFIVY